MAGRTLREISTFMNLHFLKGKDYRVIKNLFEFHQVINEIQACQGLIGFDTETDGINVCCLPWGSPNKHYAVGLCLSWKDNQGIYIPLRHTKFDNIPIKEVVKHLFPLLETKPLATHNGIFDYKVMYDLGCALNIVHDSMLLIFNICSKVGKGTKALKNITRTLYGHTTIEFSDIFPNTEDYGKFAEIEEDVCQAYACADPDYTRRIVIDNIDALSETQMEAYMNDCHYIPLVAEAEYYGKPIDLKQAQKDQEVCENNIKYLEQLMYNYVGWKLTGNLNERYTFKESSQPELVDVMYRKLKYTPVEVKNKTGYKIDKFVLKRLCQDVLADDEEDEFVVKVIKETKPNLLDPEKPIIDYPKLKKSKHVLAHLLTAYRKQQKELTSFFNKIIRESNSDIGRYFSPISMTNTETARLVDFMQTLDGVLKYLVCIPDCLKQYMFVFDFAQIEYRVMVALACMYGIVKKLDDPHTDFHVVIAALILNVRPEDITDEVRKKFKSINFGIPYGMAVKGLVDSIYGIGLSPKKQKEAEEEVTQRLEAWCKALPEIISMLDNYRDIACTPREYSHPTMRGFTNTSYVQSLDGRARVFDLKDESKQVVSKIRRMAGNFPIQCFAAALFKLAVNNLRVRLIKEGLMNTKIENPESFSGYSFASKITFNGFIHDEAIGFSDNDVNPYYLMSLIREECMLKLTGHPTYYCGINIVRNWGEGKEGKFEAPIEFVDAYKSNEKIVTPRSDWQDVVANDITNFCNKASREYVESIAGPELTEGHILNITTILPKWKDYYYKKKIKSYGYTYRGKSDAVYTDKDGKPTADDKLYNKLGGLLISEGYPEVYIKYPERTDHVTTVMGTVDPEIKEVALTDKVYAQMDYDILDEPIDDFIVEDIFSEEELEMEARALAQNNKTLVSFLTKEF